MEAIWLAAAVTLLSSMPPAKASTVASTFAQYCAGGTHARPFCGDHVPENVQWLVLHSLCLSDAARGEPYAAVCAELAVVDRQSTRERRFLVYDANTDRWSAVVYRKGTAGAYRRATAGAWAVIDESGTPTVTRGPSDDVPVIIENVNPLVYGTTPEAVTSDEIDALASLQTLAAGIGSALQEAIALAARTRPPASPTSSTTTAPAQIALSALLQTYDDMVRRLRDAASDVARDAAQLEIVRAQAIASVQDVEYQVSRNPGSLTVRTERTWPFESVAALSIDASMDRLDAAYQAIGAFGLACRPLVSDFAGLLQHADDPEAVVALAVDRFIRTHRRTECEPAFAPLAAAILDDAATICAKAASDGLAVTCGGTPAVADPFGALMRSARAMYADGLAALLAPPPKSGTGAAPMDAALTLLTSKRADAVTARQTLLAAAARRSRGAFDATTTITWLWVRPRTDRLPWNVRQTHTFSLTADAPLADRLVVAYPNERRLHYQVQSRRSAAIGVGLGVVYTPVTQPAWDAVTDPNDPARKIIARTDASTRAGQIAIFADWRFASVLDARAEAWRLRPSLQVGANTSATAGFFVGGGVDLFQYVRVGAGRTWQQSKRLNGQVEGMPVASRSDIRTEDFLASDWYASFTFALDALPLFKKSVK